MSRKVIEIEFESTDQANEFMVWMSEQGEQDYFNWLEDTEEEENKVNYFAYDWSSNQIKATYKE